MFAASKTKGVSAVAANYIEDVFSTYLYTGNGSTQTINNGIDLAGKGGLVWFKYRAGPNGPANHQLYDTARGVQKKLATNTTAAEATEVTGLTAFNANGFSFGSDGNINASSSDTYASWTFRKQPKFFDVVTYTGTGSQQSINHSLGSVPGCVIVKRTDATSSYWGVYHRSLTDTYAIGLNTFDAQFSAPSYFVNSASQTATQFTVGTSANVNASGGTYVAYIFAHNAGGFGATGNDNVITCGSYTGNGSTTGPVVTLGYEPQWLLIKSVTDATDWNVVDNMRGFWVGDTSTTSHSPRLRPNQSNAEQASGFVIPNATGFQLYGPNAASSTYNGSGSTYIYIAIRRGPMKVPTDATKVFAPLARTGNGTTTSISSIGFPPDLAVIQTRNAGLSQGAQWTDKLRGAGRLIQSYNTGSEFNANPDAFVSFDQNGYTVGPDTNGYGTNYNTFLFANWAFRRAPGFFDEVCYTGTGAITTQSHNLGVTPELMIAKRRDAAASWVVYSSGIAVTDILTLQSANAAGTNTAVFNSTAPTSSVFTVGTSSVSNASGGTYVNYLFASCPGVSKVGSYTGNGTTQTINCSFTGGARFVLIKRTDSTGDWYVYDTARGMTVLVDPYLQLNSTAAESATLGSVITTSVGFIVDATILAAVNTNGASYIFLAIS